MDWYRIYDLLQLRSKITFKKIISMENMKICSPKAVTWFKIRVHKGHYLIRNIIHSIRHYFWTLSNAVKIKLFPKIS